MAGAPSAGTGGRRDGAPGAGGGPGWRRDGAAGVGARWASGRRRHGLAAGGSHRARRSGTAGASGGRLLVWSGRGWSGRGVDRGLGWRRGGQDGWRRRGRRGWRGRRPGGGRRDGPGGPVGSGTVQIRLLAGLAALDQAVRRLGRTPGWGRRGRSRLGRRRHGRRSGDGLVPGGSRRGRCRVARRRRRGARRLDRRDGTFGPRRGDRRCRWWGGLVDDRVAPQPFGVGLAPDAVGLGLHDARRVATHADAQRLAQVESLFVGEPEFSTEFVDPDL